MTAGMEAGGAVAQVIAAYASGVSAQVGPVSENQVGPLQPEKEEKKKTWIGIQLKSFDGSPMPNQDFQVTLDGGQVLSGRTDEKGHARFENIDPDQGQVVFTRIPQSQDRTRKEAAKEDPSQQRPDGPHFPEADQSQTSMKGKEEEK